MRATGVGVGATVPGGPRSTPSPVPSTVPTQAFPGGPRDVCPRPARPASLHRPYRGPVTGPSRPTPTGTSLSLPAPYSVDVPSSLSCSTHWRDGREEWGGREWCTSGSYSDHDISPLWSTRSSRGGSGSCRVARSNSDRLSVGCTHSVSLPRCIVCPKSTGSCTRTSAYPPDTPSGGRLHPPSDARPTPVCSRSPDEKTGTGGGSSGWLPRGRGRTGPPGRMIYSARRGNPHNDYISTSFCAPNSHLPPGPGPTPRSCLTRNGNPGGTHRSSSTALFLDPRCPCPTNPSGTGPLPTIVRGWGDGEWSRPGTPATGPVPSAPRRPGS